jgi:hypothetical protein
MAPLSSDVILSAFHFLSDQVSGHKLIPPIIFYHPFDLPLQHYTFKRIRCYQHSSHPYWSESVHEQIPRPKLYLQP